MSAKANYFKLGLFIIGAVVLGIAAILVLGAGRLFRKDLIIETYLDQSVQGIEVGSKVKYRGVSIGNVKKIGFTRDRYSGGKTGLTSHSYVLVEIQVTSLPFVKTSVDELDRSLPQEVRRGLRARLTSQGVTGTSYVEIDYLDPERYPPLAIDWTPDNAYIPSAPSAFSRIVSSAEEVFGELERIDFKGIADNVDRLVQVLDRKLSELPVGTLSTNAVALLAEARDSNQRLLKLLDRPELDAILKDASSAAAGLRRTTDSPALTNSVAQLQKTLRRLDQLVAGQDHNLGVALDNLRILTENLRDLSENATRFPAQLFFGEPPKPINTAR
jgi:paraquat-inducible protein B